MSPSWRLPYLDRNTSKRHLPQILLLQRQTLHAPAYSPQSLAFYHPSAAVGRNPALERPQLTPVSPRVKLAREQSSQPQPSGQENHMMSGALQSESTEVRSPMTSLITTNTPRHVNTTRIHDVIENTQAYVPKVTPLKVAAAHSATHTSPSINSQPIKDSNADRRFARSSNQRTQQGVLLEARRCLGRPLSFQLMELSRPFA